MIPEDLRRCPRCGAFDAWEPDPLRASVAGIVVIEWRCGVCHQTWRIPIRPTLRP